MRSLLVLYDDECPLCIRCRQWLQAQASLVPLRFESCRSGAGRERFARLPWIGDELVVVADDGRAWAGPAAFVVCLWALAGYRPLAWTLASPALGWLARWVFRFVSANRAPLGSLLGAGACHEGHCGVPKRAGVYR